MAVACSNQCLVRAVLVAALVSSGAASACSRSANANAAADGQGKKAELSPAITQKAEEILNANPDAPLGSEHPFTYDGKRYVGRIEEHDNAAGDPGRPSGKHRGVTVYVAE